MTASRCCSLHRAGGRSYALRLCPQHHNNQTTRTRRSSPTLLPAFNHRYNGEVKTTTTSREWQVPSLLLRNDSAAAATVYTVRLTTSYDRGSALSEPLAGVNVCLIGEGGRAVMHRISPVNDPKDNMKAVEDICSLIGEESGADCASLGSADLAPAWPNNKEVGAKPRFQEGSVDEVSFMAPELGCLAAIMVAPEGGSWVCDEVDVFSSRSKHMDRFVCRKRLGGRKGEAAAYLTPVPPDAVVYGTGDAARIITKEQAAALQAMSMADYGELKARLLLTTALLTVGGSGVAALASGMDAAVPFALGGMAGLLYQLLLQLGADAAVATAAAASPSTTQRSDSDSSSNGGSQAAADFKQRLLKVFGSSAVRLLLVTSAAVLAVWALQDNAGNKLEGSEVLFHLSAVDAWQMGLGLCGFLMYKVAVLSVSLVPGSPSPAAAAAQQAEKNA